MENLEAVCIAAKCHENPKFTSWNFTRLPGASTNINIELPDEDVFVHQKCSPPWYGITCDANKHILKLNLSNSGLTGPLNSRIGYFTRLVHLDLSKNELTGSVPDFLALANTTRQPLQYLDLSDNKFVGSTPADLSLITGLTLLKLNKNNFTSISVRDVVFPFPSLKVLDISSNLLTGSFPSFVLKISSLNRLAVARNKFSATIPELSSMTNLAELDLSGNVLTGTVPEFLQDLTKLSLLLLNHTKVSGPFDLCRLAGKARVDISQTDVSCYYNCWNKQYPINSIYSQSTFKSVGETECDLPTGQPTSQPTRQPTSQPTTRPSQLCLAGEYLDPDDNICYLCAAGKYKIYTGSETEDTCSKCPAGTFSDPGASVCTKCPKGTFQSSDGNGVTIQACINCPQQSYASELGTVKCTLCPVGRITSSPGAVSVNDCVSPEFNFIQAIVMVLLIIPLIYDYLIRGRFQRISFMRKSRVSMRLVEDSRNITCYIRNFNFKVEAELLTPVAFRRLKTWAWLFGTFGIVIFSSILAYFTEMSGIFFKAIILFKALELKFPFTDRIIASVKYAAKYVGAEFLEEILIPLKQALHFLEFFKIDFSAINVTCAGSTAPFELFLNILVIGTVMVLIESDFQLYKTVTYTGMMDENVDMLGKYVYVKWSVRSYGKKLQRSYMGIISFLFDCAGLAFRKFAMDIDIFQNMLQYLMSLVVMQRFYSNGGIHETSDACNSVIGWENFDIYIAFISSLLFYLMFFPAMYEVSNIIMPGIPPGVSTVLWDVSEEAKDFRKGIGLHRVLKYFSYLAFDLWWAKLVANHLNSLLERIPYDVNHSAPSLRDMTQLVIEKNNLERGKIFKQIHNIESPEVLVNDEREFYLNESTTFHRRKALKILETPHAPAYRVVAHNDEGYTVLYTSNRVIHDVDVWKEHSQFPFGCYALVRIERSTGQVVFTETYDIATEGRLASGRDRTHFVDDLNSSSSAYVTIVVANGDLSANRDNNQLLAAICRCGGSHKYFGGEMQSTAYVLIGVPDSGEFGGVEICQNHEILVNFRLTDRDDDERGWEIDEEETNTASFILSSMKERTTKENIRWKRQRLNRMPAYQTLCQKEFDELMEVIGARVPCFLLVMFGVGNFCTLSGRKAMFIILWKLWHFGFVCLGIWTDVTVQMYEVHDKVLSFSCFAKEKTQWSASSMASKEDDLNRYQSRKTLAKASKEAAPTRESSTKMQDVAIKRTRDRTGIERLYEYSGGSTNTFVELEDEYGQALYALIASRATICQVIPFLSIISIFATNMSSCPIFVYSEELLINLQDTIVKNPRATARRMFEKRLDHLRRIRRYESSEDVHCLPNPSKKFVDGELVEVPIQHQMAIQAHNDEARARMRKLLAQPQLEVEEWKVLFLAIVEFTNDSRYISYAVNLFKFILTVLFLYLPDKYNQQLVIASICVIYPYKLILSMQWGLRFGHAMHITDAEIMHEIGPVVKFFAEYICCGLYDEDDFDEADIGDEESTLQSVSSKTGKEIEMQTFKKSQEHMPSAKALDQSSAPEIAPDAGSQQSSGASSRSMWSRFTGAFSSSPRTLADQDGAANADADASAGADTDGDADGSGDHAKTAPPSQRDADNTEKVVERSPSPYGDEIPTQNADFVAPQAQAPWWSWGRWFGTTSVSPAATESTSKKGRGSARISTVLWDSYEGDGAQTGENLRGSFHASSNNMTSNPLMQPSSLYEDSPSDSISSHASNSGIGEGISANSMRAFTRVKPAKIKRVTADAVGSSKSGHKEVATKVGAAGAGDTADKGEVSIARSEVTRTPAVSVFEIVNPMSAEGEDSASGDVAGETKVRVMPRGSVIPASKLAHPARKGSLFIKLGRAKEKADVETDRISIHSRELGMGIHPVDDDDSRKAQERSIMTPEMYEKIAKARERAERKADVIPAAETDPADVGTSRLSSSNEPPQSFWKKLKDEALPDIAGKQAAGSGMASVVQQVIDQETAAKLARARERANRTGATTIREPAARHLEHVALSEETAAKLAKARARAETGESDHVNTTLPAVEIEHERAPARPAEAAAKLETAETALSPVPGKSSAAAIRILKPTLKKRATVAAAARNKDDIPSAAGGGVGIDAGVGENNDQIPKTSPSSDGETSVAAPTAKDADTDMDENENEK